MISSYSLKEFSWTTYWQIFGALGLVTIAASPHSFRDQLGGGSKDLQDLCWQGSPKKNIRCKQNISCTCRESPELSCPKTDREALMHTCVFVSVGTNYLILVRIPPEEGEFFNHSKIGKTWAPIPPVKLPFHLHWKARWDRINCFSKNRANLYL